MSTTWVYRFDQIDEAQEFVGGDWDRVRGLLGGKGANLEEMVCCQARSDTSIKRHKTPVGRSRCCCSVVPVNG